MDKLSGSKIKWIVIAGGITVSLAIVSVIAIGADKDKETKPAVGVAPANEVLAEVNGKKITVSEFYAQMKRMAGEGQMQMDSPALRKKLLEGMIKEELLMQEAEKQGLEKDPAVQNEIEQAKQQIIVRELVRREVIEKTKSVDEKELKTYYDGNKSQFPSPEQVHARHILLKTKAEADAIKAQLDKGADFTKLAKEKSIDPGTAGRGGDLGFFSKDEMIPEFSKVAFSLTTGKISAPVKSQFGYHIIKVEGKKAGGTMGFEEAKPYIERRLVGQKQREKLESWLDLLEKNAKVTTHPELVGISEPPA
ncbi:MAG: peptidylprolyl isomerase, partial [bacterium]|nr:peptidylprolyl isomerase [bacterium]